MRCVLWLGSLLGFYNPFFARAELRKSSHKAARVNDIPLDDTEGDLPPLNAPEASPQQRWSLSAAVNAATQDPMHDPETFADETMMVMDPTESKHLSTEVQPPSGRFPHISHVSNHPSLLGNRREVASQKMTSRTSRVQAPVVEEFDVVENGIPTSGVSESHGRVLDGEAKTAEDMDREKRGDFDKVLPPVMPARISSHIQQSLARTRSVSTQDSKSAGSVMKDKPGPKKMMAQCMAFANYLKTQDVAGPELIRMWKGSCDPIVASGDGDASFTTMCDAMGGALEPYVMKGAGWPPDKVCKDVLKVFNEAGIGV